LEVGRGKETEKLLTGGLKLPEKATKLKTWPFCKRLFVFEASKKEKVLQDPAFPEPRALSSSSVLSNKIIN
jgi:hypothetical protein